jgi:hypothetical protein
MLFTKISVAIFVSMTLLHASLPAAGQAPQQGVVRAEPGNAYSRANQLPARIIDFKIEPLSIQAGQAATIFWATENQNGIVIDPDIGNQFQARGSRQIHPTATTTYKLTVNGPAGQVLTREVTVTVVGKVPAATGRPRANLNQASQIPRMPDGKPNLSGVYNAIFPGTFFAGGPAMNSAGVPGPRETKPVLKPGAEKFKVVRGPTDTGLSSDCMPLGVPQSLFIPYQWQIVQGLDRVVILYEYPNVFRVIPITGAPHEAGRDLDPTWMGDSVGRWEGDVLVVDTIGFNDKTEVPGGFRHTEALHVVERFRRTSGTTLEYEATIEDPNVFEKPWVLQRNFPLRPDLERVGEFVCENNRDYRPLFGNAK